MFILFFMNRMKSINLIFGISTAVLFIFSMWFFILIGIANPYAYQKLDMFEKPLNKTKRIIVDYNLEFKAPSVSIQEINDQSIHSTIDVGGIMTGVITGGILMILTKLFNRFWPDKK